MPGFLLYVDPTAAGLGLQMLLGGVVGGLVTIKLFWGRVFSLFRTTEQETDDTSASGEEPSKVMEKEA